MSAIITLMAGLLVIALDFEIYIGGAAINIISDLVGYILVIFSAKQLIVWSPCFKKTIKHGILALVFYIGLRTSINIAVMKPLQLFFLGFGIIFYIYMTYYIMEGIAVKNKTEKLLEQNSNLRGAWVAMAIAAFLYCFSSLIDIEAIMEGFGVPGLENIILMILNAATLITTVFFIMVLNQNRVLLSSKKENKK